MNYKQLIALIFVFSLTANGSNQMAIGISAGVPIPTGSFSTSYSLLTSGDLKIGFFNIDYVQSLDEQRYSSLLSSNLPSILRNDLVFSFDIFRYNKEIQSQGSISDRLAYIGALYYENSHYANFFGLRYPYISHFGGAGWFGVNNNLYGQLGGTGTLLGDNNWKASFLSGWGIGANIPIAKRSLIGLSYDFTQIDKSFMVWHCLVSGFMIQTVPTETLLYFGDRAEDPSASGICSIVALALQVGFYALDCWRRNWPFDDSEPLRYGKPAISYTLTF
jgi:hypothetical protein